MCTSLTHIKSYARRHDQESSQLEDFYVPTNVSTLKDMTISASLTLETPDDVLRDNIFTRVEGYPAQSHRPKSLGSIAFPVIPVCQV